MVHPLKVTSTLADDTRFSIYQYMLQEKEAFTVQKIADQFGIHPNVARLHLTKLVEIDAITSMFEKTGRGGRPGRIYRIAETGISLSFPKRNYEELLGLVLEVLVELGPDSIEFGKKVSYRRGQSDIRKIIQAQGQVVSSMNFEAKIDVITEAATLIGYVPVIKELENGQKMIHFAVYNCPYHNEIAEYANLVCSLHESYLKGQFDFLFSVDDFIQIESMTDGCKYCSYNVSTN